ncbi:glucosamine--fructose-6-phosphate aminotransferase [Thermoclostridium stercorarium subsp. stercorarium DSM 8532]|jgi:glucosamine--fructose-6-phosphate aminotransferase (isomerizing)|uniref:Glutamine--fructose-6-phosphate aminotransferase [isomerizing] n=3 Tax=Thermoclostridium stercorarium TaxID=1510 RepID=L7VQX7_THES1|nr:glutamine--fructose-6-phosphate transaminase (isomerizing) [Thermoclostridium stercorarium]AGC68796.1 glucosamine--fructose-6-phosphate aminotransferase [Thermoclostridium stercorarium subsp. stercorarium DSM 8532]AGI39799.1 glucosamine-fructose-6-phosphate aminotransferase [Thermoclostridium stercorarium subsp. stercorarium DSM 8532]ANW99111.1 glutamine--fructose-6-phosphate aminotransferase [Thermoclostridium stercorarium subsp. thermolacticum DSM 2910]ANX01670.1 glutamine--fructose-6-phos
MCGIIGYIGKENAVPIILDGLKRLEYRGYDSAGIAIMNEKGFEVAKQKGRLTALEELIKQRPIKGYIGIGHTRWATHGEPSDINSHPHVGSKNKIAIVHNGIIENYKQIKERLEQKGIKFVSQTDSEVIAQLAEYYYNGDIVETVIKTANALEGSYALGIMCLDEPNKLIAIKKDNPLIIGVAEHGNFIASDVPAILKHTNRVYYLNDKEIAVLTKSGVEFYNMDREPIYKEPEIITWSVDSAEKGGYEHFMLKEIMEQPRAIRDTIQSVLANGDNGKVIESLDVTRFSKFVITGCGSAYNAGVVAKYVFEKLCRVPVEVELASEFRYKDPIIDNNTLVILISQSGETADTIAAMREAKRRGAVTLSIVNVMGSTIAKETDYTLYTMAGPEIAVATTKAFSAQLVMLYLLAVTFARKLGKLSDEEERKLFSEIASLPDKVSEMLKNVDTIQKYATTCVGYKSIFFIGRNIDYAIALEGSLKLKEISYIHSEAYAGGELKHGTISLIEDNTLVVAISCCERLYEKIYSNVEQVISRGAKVLFIGNCIKALPGEKLEIVNIPVINELFSPSLSVIILQLFSYYVAANKGLDIDKPRNLAKSVTVE